MAEPIVYCIEISAKQMIATIIAYSIAVAAERSLRSRAVAARILVHVIADLALGCRSGAQIT
jgi:ribosomal protein S3